MTVNIDVQDFCNSHGLITNDTVKQGIRKLAKKHKVIPIPEYDASNLWYKTGNCNAVNTSAIKNYLKNG